MSKQRSKPASNLRIVPSHSGKTLQFRAFCDDSNDSDQPCGFISALRARFDKKAVYRVGLVDVDERFRRRGIATKLYEALAKETCNRKARLVSMYRIAESPSTAFWDKQVAKGRAIKKISGKGKERLTAYVLNCPVTTLDGKVRNNV